MILIFFSFHKLIDLLWWFEHTHTYALPIGRDWLAGNDIIRLTFIECVCNRRCFFDLDGHQIVSIDSVLKAWRNEKKIVWVNYKFSWSLIRYPFMVCIFARRRCIFVFFVNNYFTSKCLGETRCFLHATFMSDVFPFIENACIFYDWKFMRNSFIRILSPIDNYNGIFSWKMQSDRVFLWKLLKKKFFLLSLGASRVK